MFWSTTGLVQAFPVVGTEDAEINVPPPFSAEDPELFMVFSLLGLEEVRI